MNDSKNDDTIDKTLLNYYRNKSYQLEYELLFSQVSSNIKIKQLEAKIDEFRNSRRNVKGSSNDSK